MSILPKKENVLPNLKKLFNGAAPKTQTRHAPPKKDINLLPESVLEQRRFDEISRLTSLALAGFLAIALSVLTIPFGKSITLEIEKTRLVKRIDETSAVEELEKKVSASREVLKSRQDYISWINKSDTVIAAIFASFEKIIPKTLFLTEVAQRTVEIVDKDKNKESVRVIFVKGLAESKDGVADFQNSLVKSALYEDVFINKMEEQDIRTEKNMEVSRVDEFGAPVTEIVTIGADERISVSFEMECVLRDWFKE